MAIGFAYEKLRVYRLATEFVTWASEVLDQVPTKLAVYDQLDRASISIALNIAEANSKLSASDRCRFYDTSRGSALECAACLDVLVAKNVSTMGAIISGKRKLQGIVKELLNGIASMLVGLIKNNEGQGFKETELSYSSLAASWNE